MALDQNRYIRISTNVGNTAIGIRDFNGLAFTTTAMLSGAGALKTAYDKGEVVQLTKQQVTTCFGSSSSEVAFADKYFAYCSPEGFSPTKLSFAKIGVGSGETTPLQAFNRVVSGYNNFGSFTVLGKIGSSSGELTAAQIKAVADANAALNSLFLFCISLTPENYTAVTTAVGKPEGTFYSYAKDHVYGAYRPMSIVASARWDLANSSPMFMFKEFPSDTYDVETEELADALDALNVNYLGRVHTNGQMVDFLQRGFNADGTDTGVFCNEMWFKASVATSYFNLVLRMNKIPANDDGAAMIRSAISDVITRALDNGTILVGKPLDNNDKAYIYSLTENENAFDLVQSQGFYLMVWIAKDGTEYKAYYRLIYSKGDGVRFTEGVHNLV